MTCVNYTVNQNGLDQIKNILREKHKAFQNQEATAENLSAWASDVEDSLNNGNDASFEIKSWDHVMGRTETFELSSGGYDAEEIEE